MSMSPDPTRTSDATVPRRGPGSLVMVALAVVVLLSAGLVVLAVHLRSQQLANQGQLLRPSGVPSSMSTNLANEMFLSALPRRAAPNFTLSDQRGRTMSLDHFKGRTVVLEFMDSHCIDICPLVSQEFVDAYHDLGSGASKVVFMAINVNQFHARVQDMAAFSNAHRLNTIPSWHFFTGPTPALQAAWRAYGVQVSAPHPNADILHTSALYVIDPQGRERFIASPQVAHTSTGKAYLPAATITQWGRGIADLAESLTH